MKTTTLVCLCLLLLAPLGAAAEKPVERTVAASADGSVEIENLAGSIRVEGWNQSQVQVTGTLGDDVEELEVRSSGGTVSIEVKLPQGRHSGDKDFSADLVVKVPRDSSIETSLVSSSVTVEGVYGSLELTTVSGAIEARGEPQEAELQSVSGTITADLRTDDLEVETVNGDVQLAGSFRELNLNAVNSNLNLDLGAIEEASLQNVSGDLTVSADPGAGGSLSISVHSGDIRLTLPAGVSADFDVNTFSGDIDNAFGPPAKRTSEYAPGKNVSFSTGGGARIEVQSFSGDVFLIKG
jgi:DUF4097 and DUF4098 domain-containing protein YvlB